MARKKLTSPTSVLGLHFQPDAIQVVEVRKHGAEFVATAAGTVQMTPGYLEPSAAGGTGYIGQKLRSLLKEIGSSTKSAYIGVPSHASMTRQIDLPPIPEAELRTAIDGEIRHHQMLSDKGGTFDFMVMGDIQDNVERNVLVMAADDLFLWRIQDILKEAGVTAEAFVPIHSAALRSALGTPPKQPTLYVSLDMNSTEIAIVDEESTRLYRRIDVRGSDLVVKAAKIEQEAELATASAGLHEGEVPFALRLAQEGRSEGIDPVIASRLVTELRRSLEYFRRQNPSELPVQDATIVVADDRLMEISDMIATDLGLNIVRGSNGLLTQGSATHELSTLPDIGEYAPAIGLGLQAFDYGAASLKPFSLRPSERVVERATKVNQSLVPALIGSAAIGVLGLSVTLVYYFGANKIEAQNVVDQGKLDKLVEEYLPMQQEAQLEMRAMGELALAGIPFPPIMDQVSDSLHDDLGILTATFDTGGRISLEGESRNEEAIISTLNRLRMSGGFYNTDVIKIASQTTSGLRFSIRSQYDLENPARLAIEDYSAAQEVTE